MLKAVGVADKEADAEQMAVKLNEYFKERVLFEGMPVTGDIMGDIRKENPDLLVTLDLAGFDRTTFTDGVAYNLLDCKQVHLILQEDLENEKYLAKPLSIAMFFGTVGEAYGEELVSKYPEIPWLRVIDNKHTEAKGNYDRAIGQLIEIVLKECKLV